MINCPSCGNERPNSETGCPQCNFSPSIIDGFPAWAPDLAAEGGGFKADYFAPLAQHEQSNFWFRSRNALLIWALKKYFPDLSSFLEVGCGTGFVLSGVSTHFPHARLVGSEVFTAGLAFAASRVPEAAFVQMDARYIPYRDEFNVAAAFDVIEHIEEDETVLANLYKAVKPGGGLILTVPQHHWLWSSADDYACHVRRYSAADLHKKMRAAGFSIIRSTSFVSLLLPAMLMSRRRAQDKDRYDPYAEFRINPMLNRALERVLTVERQLICAGINFPLGGSRLVVAKKLERTHDPV